MTTNAAKSVTATVKRIDFNLLPSTLFFITGINERANVYKDFADVKKTQIFLKRS